MTARPGQRWADDQVKPCGTPAAARRHHRRGEPLCFACQTAQRVSRGDFRPDFDPRPVRNGVPETIYAYRARRYPWAEQALARAEAMYGRPANEAS